ncbi:uncharacterized protein [Gossypium hirsutum]|uniref:Retrovirus-related Pol polyprotein from transposon TNT 1-94-like beta-barrel domain-containing protein n=1 Tax=Gossypium hirsutum TaxID=3635 RepID=A0A1U8IE46_GOSHI|nr:uncharacterized protein LOC107895751 [Gossypium hirsutum]
MSITPNLDIVEVWLACSTKSRKETRHAGRAMQKLLEQVQLLFFVHFVVKMNTYLQAFDLWEVVNSDVEPEPLRANPIVAQIRQHTNERTKRHKAMFCIQNSVQDVIFTRIMACETPKQEEEIVKQYSDRIMAVVNSIRLLGEQFSEARIVEKVSFKKRPNLLRAPLPTKAKRLRETSQSQILQEKGTNFVGIAKDLVIQKPTAGIDQMCSANAAKGWAMLKRTCKTKVKIANSHFMKEEGKRDVLICTPTGNKFISNVLLEPEIDGNLFSIAQLLEKRYFIVFKGNECQISDPSGSKIMAVNMAKKSFVVD